MAIPNIPEVGDFLPWFRAKGWYLTDLWPTPINHLSNAERRRLRVDGERELARFIAETRPPVVVVVMLAIEENVRKAIAQANHRADVYCLPFPTQGHQFKFERGLAAIVRLLADRVEIVPTQKPQTRWAVITKIGRVVVEAETADAAREKAERKGYFVVEVKRNASDQAASF